MATDLLHWFGVDYLLAPQKRIYWLYLVVALAIGLGVGHFKGQAWRAWLGAGVWWHPSARLDYRYFLVVSLIKWAIILPLLFSAGDVAVAVVRNLDQYFGYRAKLSWVEWPALVTYGFCLFLGNDLSRYALHRLMHRVPFLWSIHRVHHSAEVLTPFTFYRIHPLENLLFGMRYALVAGAITGVFIYAYGVGLDLPQIAGANAVVVILHLLGDNLRHSHLPLGYPNWLERVLISPAQHQRHHDERGARSNYGGVFAFWDWAFGSLRLSRAGEQYRFGDHSLATHRSVVSLLVAPFSNLRLRLPCQVVILLLLLWLPVIPALAQDTADLSVELGRALFFDTSLSQRGNLSCASCHDPQHGFIDSRENFVGAAASIGDDLKSLGDRNTPSLSYAALIPDFHFDPSVEGFKGGLFWDGRARDLQHQAGQPILNPNEMGMLDQSAVVARVFAQDYYRAGFEQLYGEPLLTDDSEAFAAIAAAIADFEKTDLFSPFDSKYDRYLRGQYELSDMEDLGMSIFFSTTNANCSSCHQLKTLDDQGEPFSNYEFHNIGTPINRSLRQQNGLGLSYQDLGLGVQSQAQKGKFRVPSLRNVGITSPYMHNGVFRELRTVIEFYDQFNNPNRAKNPETGKPWRKPEVVTNLDLSALKAKRLSGRKVSALVAFLKTLTDQRFEYLLELPPNL